jgi:SAM-dependent methyltransferase
MAETSAGEILPFDRAACLAAAGRLYRTGPPLLRRLQHHRPRVCPFELLIPHVPPGSHVLDVGCGAGLFLGLLDEAGRLAAGFGVEVSAPAVALARRLPGVARGRLAFTLATPADPLPAGPFDVVSMIDVAHHVRPAAQRGTIEAAFARVRPGGVFLYKDMARRPRLSAWANRLHDMIVAWESIHYLPIEDVDRWINELGGVRRNAFTARRLWYRHEVRVYRRPAAPPAG